MSCFTLQSLHQPRHTTWFLPVGRHKLVTHKFVVFDGVCCCVLFCLRAMLQKVTKLGGIYTGSTYEQQIIGLILPVASCVHVSTSALSLRVWNVLSITHPYPSPALLQGAPLVPSPPWDLPGMTPTGSLPPLSSSSIYPHCSSFSSECIFFDLPCRYSCICVILAS